MQNHPMLKLTKSIQQPLNTEINCSSEQNYMYLDQTPIAQLNTELLGQGKHYTALKFAVVHGKKQQQQKRMHQCKTPSTKTPIMKFLVVQIHVQRQKHKHSSLT